MHDRDCVALLQWCLPKIGLTWPGYRRVRRTVCKRISRRMRELGLDKPDDYRAFLAQNAREWERLEAFCRIPISRFYRDCNVFRAIGDEILPRLAKRADARPDRTVRCWCAGCASGEEVYTLGMIWHVSVQPAFPGVGIDIVGTDVDATVLERARRGCYASGSLKDLPTEYRDRGFRRCGDLYCVEDSIRSLVRFERQDIRTELPAGPFDLILCRNMVFTYFVRGLQEQIQARIDARAAGGSYLIIGSHERLPMLSPARVRAFGGLPIYRYVALDARRPDAS